MAKMRALQPRLKALQDRYKDDRKAMSQALMDLYKREKVNPVAGCLPMVIQIPFFIAFYWVLLESGRDASSTVYAMDHGFVDAGPVLCVAVVDGCGDVWSTKT